MVIIEVNDMKNCNHDGMVDGEKLEMTLKLYDIRLRWNGKCYEIVEEE